MKEVIVLVSNSQVTSWKEITTKLSRYIVEAIQVTETSSFDKEYEIIVEKTSQSKSHFLCTRETLPLLLSYYEKHQDSVATITLLNILSESEATTIQTYFLDNANILSTTSCPFLILTGLVDEVNMTEVNFAKRILPCAQMVHYKDSPQVTNSFWNEHFLSFLITNHYDPMQTLITPKNQETVELPSSTVAERLLRVFKLRGVDYIFSNSGTDFTPIIDAYANCDENDVPEFIGAPHENTTISMAHGFALVSRKIQACMAHVHVGTANVGLGIMNASRSRTPIFVMAGRSPYYEEGMPGVRTNFVQWSQESIDQGASFREYLKWDYELRGGHAMEKVIERGLGISTSNPQGPVYLTLPKEPLCQTVDKLVVPKNQRMNTTASSTPQKSSLESAVKWIKSSKNIVIVVADLGRFVGGAEALVRFSVSTGAGVVEFGKRNFFNFPTEHPHHLGFEPFPPVLSADLVICIECPVPWIPAFAPKDFKAPPVITIAVDPLFSELPLRGFPSDLSLGGDSVVTLKMLTSMIGKGGISKTLSEKHDEIFNQARIKAKKDESLDKITKTYLSYQIGQVVDDDCIIFNEYNCDPFLVPRRTSSSWYENSSASGLGWALGAALGAQVALPNKTMIVTMGDGSYLFNTPLSAHHVASSYQLPIIIIVFNDSAWSTIKKSVKGSHPKGESVKKDKFILCDFNIDMQFEKICDASGGIGIKVEDPKDLNKALKDAIEITRNKKKHVLLNVVCMRDG